MCNPRRWGASEAGKADHGSESIVGVWPVGSDGVEAGAVDDATQHGGDDDGGVRITDRSIDLTTTQVNAGQLDLRSRS